MSLNVIEDSIQSENSTNFCISFFLYPTSLLLLSLCSLLMPTSSLLFSPFVLFSPTLFPFFPLYFPSPLSLHSSLPLSFLAFYRYFWVFFHSSFFLPNVLSPFPFLVFSFFSHYLLFPLSFAHISTHFSTPSFFLSLLHLLPHFISTRFSTFFTSSPRLSSLLNLPPFYLIYPLLSLLPLHSPLSIIRINTIFIFSPLSIFLP